LLFCLLFCCSRYNCVTCLLDDRCQMGVGPQALLGCFRGRSFAGTYTHTHADRRARLRQTVLLPVHPLRSIRRSQGRDVSRSIALPACKLPGPTFPYPENSAIRSRRPAVSAPSLSWRNIGACRSPRRPTLASSRGSRVSMHRFARGQPSPSICWRNPERPVAARRESPF
jgi:hypothetical protein